MERFAQAYEDLPADLREGVHGVTCNCVNPDGDLVGDPFPESPRVTDVFDMLYRHRVRGEKWGFHRTEILRQFPFNTDVDRFVSENTVWFAIGARYKTLFHRGQPSLTLFGSAIVDRYEFIGFTVILLKSTP